MTNVDAVSLKAFCEKEAGLELIEQELPCQQYVIEIEDNKTLQNFCDYLGNEWREWFPLESLH